MFSVAPLRAIFLFALISVTFSFAQAGETSRYTDLDPAALANLLDKGVKVVDIRRPEEWRETGVIPGSKLLTAFDSRGQFNAEFPSEFEALVGRDEEVIIICRSGNRSAALSRTLAERAGYTRVYNASGGIVSWIDRGNQTAPCPTC